MTAKTIQTASEELADELAMKPHEAANAAVRYDELKNKTVRLVTTTGEKLTEGEWRKATDDLNDALRTYIEAQGLDGKGRYMAISVEGMPDLTLTPRGTDAVDTSGMYAHDADLFFLLVERGAVKVDVRAAKVVLGDNPDRLSRFLKDWVHKEGLTPSLSFARGPQ